MEGQKRLLDCLEPLGELVFLMLSHLYALLGVFHLLDKWLQPISLMGNILMSSNLSLSLTQSLLPYIGSAVSPVKI